MFLNGLLMRRGGRDSTGRKGLRNLGSVEKGPSRRYAIRGSTVASV